MDNCPRCLNSVEFTITKGAPTGCALTADSTSLKI